MSPFGWALLAVYVVGYVASWRAVFRSESHDLDGWAEVCERATFATLVTAFWPLALPVIAVRMAVGDDPARAGRVLGGESQQAKIKRMEREAKRREEHIRRLEREVGL